MSKRTFSFSANNELIESLRKVFNKRDIHTLLNNFLESKVWTKEYLIKQKKEYIAKVEAIDQFIDNANKIEEKLTVEAKSLINRHIKAIKEDNALSIVGLHKSFINATKIKCNIGTYLYFLNKNN